MKFQSYSVHITYDFTSKNTKLLWQHSIRFSAKMAARFKNVMNKDIIRTLQDTSENLNRPKAHQEGFFQVILPKNSENSALKPEFKLSTFQCGGFSIDNQCYKHVKNYNCECNCHQYIITILLNRYIVIKMVCS